MYPTTDDDTLRFYVKISFSVSVHLELIVRKVCIPLSPFRFNSPVFITRTIFLLLMFTSHLVDIFWNNVILDFWYENGPIRLNLWNSFLFAVQHNIYTLKCLYLYAVADFLSNIYCLRLKVMHFDMQASEILFVFISFEEEKKNNKTEIFV